MGKVAGGDGEGVYGARPVVGMALDPAGTPSPAS